MVVTKKLVGGLYDNNDNNVDNNDDNDDDNDDNNDDNDDDGLPPIAEAQVGRRLVDEAGTLPRAQGGQLWEDF